MTARKMSQAKIARQLGVSPSYLNLMVNGKRPWHSNLMGRYEELVNVSVNVFGDGVDYRAEKHVQANDPSAPVNRRWWGRWNSNPHALRHMILNPVSFVCRGSWESAQVRMLTLRGIVCPWLFPDVCPCCRQNCRQNILKVPR